MRYDVQTIVAAVTVGVAFAVVSFFTLAQLSRPADFKARASTLNETLSRAERLGHTRGNPYAYPAGAVCDNPNAGADDLKRRTEAAAAASSVSLSSLAVNPPAVGEAPGRVTPVTLQFSATGKYESVVGMLGVLASAEPQVFVDTTDLKPAAAGAVTLKLSGKVLCWTSARH
jgi:hypothetical protein